ncbi:MAG TPA: TIGR02996 domain-containing protein [Gemmataceae bacterium]|jgi:uncharacterized protein (TIGR02996 family)
MHETFLQAICEAPEDDTPRLVYADWLDEHNQFERAEFIRAQIRLTHLAPGNRRFAVLRRRARDLLAAHGEAWRQGLPKWVRHLCEFQRGFVTHVTCTALQFIKHGATLMRAAPVRSMRVRRGEGRIAALAESPHLAGLTALDLRSNAAGDAGAEALAASPHVRHLATLRLGLNNIGATGMSALAASQHLSNLTSLDLRYNFDHDNPVLAALATAPWLARLTALDLSSTHRGMVAFRVLLASPYLPRPLMLSLCSNGLSDDAVELLAASPLLEQVANLDLRGNLFRQRGIQALAASPYLARVRKLALSWNLFGDAGAHALLASPHLGQLRRLSVRHCNIESTKDALRQRFGSRVYL